MVETAHGIGDIIQTYGVATAALIGLTIAVVFVFKLFVDYVKKMDEKQEEMTNKHVAEMKDMTDKYYDSYIRVTESNAKVSEALNNNTKVIERLLDKMEE